DPVARITKLARVSSPYWFASVIYLIETDRPQSVAIPLPAIPERRITPP
ncbi:MAG: hypothetical protein ACI9NC_004731, partial [Verrucomicrobiales bacterium]